MALNDRFEVTAKIAIQRCCRTMRLSQPQRLGKPPQVGIRPNAHNHRGRGPPLNDDFLACAYASNDPGKVAGSLRLRNVDYCHICDDTRDPSGLPYESEWPSTRSVLLSSASGPTRHSSEEYGANLPNPVQVLLPAAG